MQVIDSHMHIKDENCEAIAKVADMAGAEKFNVLSLAMMENPLNNLSCLLVKAKNPGGAYAFCSLTHDEGGGECLAQLQMWMRAGFDGWKILETKPSVAKLLGVRMDDERFEPAFAWAEENQIPIIWHVGDPATFWDPDRVPSWAVESGWAYTGGGFPALEDLYAQTETVLKRHPRLKATFAHLYFTSDDEAHARRMLDAYPNIRFDITPGSEMYYAFCEDPARWRRFFLEYQERIVYGTDLESDAEAYERLYGMKMEEGAAQIDWPARWIQRWLTGTDEMDLMGTPVRGLGLTQSAAEKILGGNFLRFVGGEPKPLDRAAALEGVKWVEGILQNPRYAAKRALARETIKKLETSV